MPFIKVDVSSPVSKEKELALKTGLVQAIQCFPGKAEAGLMVQIVDNCTFFLSGNQDGETAYVKIEVGKDLNDTTSNNATAAICSLLEKELSIPPNRTYVTFESISYWGYNGKKI